MAILAKAHLSAFTDKQIPDYTGTYLVFPVKSFEDKCRQC